MKILALPPLAALLVASCGAVPAGVPSYAAVVSDLWRDLGGGESHGPVCGLMTTTPLGAAHLVEGVIFPPRPSSPLRWWWSFALFGSSCFCAFLRSVASTSLGLRRSSSGGCFAAIATPTQTDALPSYLLLVGRLRRMFCRRGDVQVDAWPPSCCYKVSVSDLVMVHFV